MPAPAGADSAWVYGPIHVLSSLVEAQMPDGNGVGLQWHISVTTKGKRPKQHHVRRALRAFDMRKAEEDNHHPGNARHFFLVVDPARRVDCECKTDETVVQDADGYRWSNTKEGACRGCELVAVTGRPCPLHTDETRRL